MVDAQYGRPGSQLPHFAPSLYLRRCGKLFPKKGKTFPGSGQMDHHELNYPSAIAAGLRKELGDTHQAVKTIMRWTGARERTVKNWLAGAYGPSGKHLIQLIHYSDEVLDAFLGLAGREQAIALRKVVTARNALADALEHIDRFMGGKSHTP
jgi:hypothetical protein